MTARALGSLLVLLCLSALLVLRPQAEERGFPHALHENMFPSCNVCHPGAFDPGKGPLMSVSAKDCEGCHNGDLVERVEFPSFPAPNPFLRFDHAIHVKEQGLECATCHAPEGSNEWNVVGARPETCMECHGGNEHLSLETECRTCHPRLTEAPVLSPERVAAFPVPANHTAPDFMTAHGKSANTSIEACATCHARELCETCHLNADSVAAIQALARDPRVALLASGRSGTWPLPESHRQPDWISRHGGDAAGNARQCATCHVQQHCETCHVNADSVAAIQALGQDADAPRFAGAGKWPLPESHKELDWVRRHGNAALANAGECATCHTRSGCERCHGAELPLTARFFEPDPAHPRGVSLPNARPPDHDPAFRINHGTAAAAQTLKCASCHAQNFCQECHAGATRPGFHPQNFFARHAADAYARVADCASCHSAETFCRDCHAGVGLSPENARTSAFHDASPFWLLQHGEAARQGLDTCASCHQQTDCLRCHSAKTGWRINPHGDDFDADRLGDRSLLMCSRCHFSDPRR